MNADALIRQEFPKILNGIEIRWSRRCM